MKGKLIKCIFLTCFFVLGVVKCLQDDEFNIYDDLYLSSLIKEANVSKPENLSCTAVSATMIHVTWDPPITGSPKYYDITWIGPEGDEHPTPTTGTEYNITGLLPCTRYRISVSSSDGDSNSEEVETDCITLPPSGTESPPPSHVELTFSSPNKATVNWEIILTLCSYTNYSITWEFKSLWGEGQESGGGEGFTEDTTYPINNLIPYSNVTTCVSTALANSDFGKPTCTSGNTPQDSPGPPTIQSITQDKESVEVTWKPPEILNGIIEDYKLTWKTDESEVNIAPLGNVLSYTLVLEPCRKYNFSVSAKTAVEAWGPPSNEFNATILNFLLEDGVSCSSNEDGSMTVSWITASSLCLASGFNAEYNWTSLWSEDYGENSTILGPEKMELKVQDAVPYSEINSCVGIKDMLDNRGCCTINTTQQVPGPPENFTCGDIMDAAVNVTWLEPIEINGVLGSWLLSVNIEDKEVFNETLPLENTIYELQDILPGPDYNVTIQASTEAGFGEAAFCIIRDPANGNDDGPNLAAIIGGTVGALLGIVFIVAAVFFGRKYQVRIAEIKGSRKRKEWQMAKAKERNLHNTNTGVDYGMKPYKKTNEEQNSSKITSTGHDNHNFRMSSSDTIDDHGYGKRSSNAPYYVNIRKPQPQAFNNQYLRRYSTDVNDISNSRRSPEGTSEARNFRRPSEVTSEARNFRRPLNNIDEMSVVGSPAETVETRNYKWSSKDYTENTSTDVNKQQNLRRPVRGIQEIGHYRRPSTDTNQIQNFRRSSTTPNEVQNYRRPSMDTTGMQDIRRPYAKNNEIPNVRRPSADVHDSDTFRRPISHNYENENFERHSPYDSKNQYFRKPSPLAYDSRNFKRAAPQPHGKRILKRPAPIPYNNQNVKGSAATKYDDQDFNRSAARSYDELNISRPSRGLYDSQDSNMFLSKDSRDEDVESIDL